MGAIGTSADNALAESFNLVPTLTAEENITLPAKTAGGGVDKQWFEEVGADPRMVDTEDLIRKQISG